jgi:hypothetical protein
MTDLIDTPKFFEENYLKKIHHPELGEVVVPYEFVHFKNYKIEDIKPAPDLQKHK